MNTKEQLLLDKKVKKKPTVVTTKLKPAPTIISRRPGYNTKPDAEKLEIREKVEKLLKPTVRKPKVEVPVKSTKTERTTKLTTSNASIANRVSAYDFDNVRPATTTNAALKQTRENQKLLETRENERRLAEIDPHFGKDDVFDSNKYNKRWSDVAHCTQEYSINVHRATTHGVLPRKREEVVNPNSEDNNLPNRAEKVRGHVRNTSISKMPARDVQSATFQEGPKLQDITNLKKFAKQTTYYESSNISYAHLDHLVDDIGLVDQPKARNIPAKKNVNTINAIEAKASKLKVKISQKENIENTMMVPDVKNLKLEKVSSQPESSKLPRNSELGERMNQARPSTLNNLDTKPQHPHINIYNGYLPSIPISKNIQSNVSSSGHTPTYSTTTGTHRLNTSTLSTRSTNTQASSSNNKCDNVEKKNSSIGRTSTNTQNGGSGSGSGSGQIKSKGNLPRLGNNLPKYSDHKTDSTYISGGSSTSPILDCEESLTNNMNGFLSAKNENLSWFDKLDVEMRTVDLFAVEDQKLNFNGMISTDKFSTGRRSITTEEELANFNPEYNAAATDSEMVEYLVMREMQYAPDPHYFDNKQNHVTWMMRAILLDWMMEVCMEFTLKRETFHYAVNYVDRHLHAVPHIQKWELQLVGVTAMYLAAKVEEIYAPKVADFARSADNGYTCQQIVDMEFKMIKNLKWFLNPPTLSTWANYYMCQWDLYVEHTDFAKNHPLVAENLEGLIQYKQPNEKSYARFREVMQLVDCAVLDVQTLQYKPRTLIASFMYMTLGKYFKQFTAQQIYDEFPHSSLHLINQEYAFNHLFGDFLMYSFGFELVDLLPSIQYGSTYFKLPLNFDLPTAAKINKENVLEGHFEEFLAYQTHHPLNVDYIRKRPRNNY